MLQKAIGKHEVNNFDIVKDNDGYLYACDEKTSQDIIYSTVNTNSVLYNYAQEQEYPIFNSSRYHIKALTKFLN